MFKQITVKKIRQPILNRIYTIPIELEINQQQPVNNIDCFRNFFKTPNKKLDGKAIRLGFFNINRVDKFFARVVSHIIFN